MTVNAAQLLALGAPRRETVQLGDGAEITVRELSAGERPTFVKVAETEPARLPILLVRLCCIAPDGSAMFRDEDDAAVAALRPEVIDEIARAVMRVSGLATAGDEKKD